GSPTTTRFTRTRLSDIVHPVSSSQLTQDPDRVRSFGGYNIALTSTCGQLAPCGRCPLHRVAREPRLIGGARVALDLAQRPDRARRVSALTTLYNTCLRLPAVSGAGQATEKLPRDFRPRSSWAN